jgi:hypothetical protein
MDELPSGVSGVARFGDGGVTIGDTAGPEIGDGPNACRHGPGSDNRPVVASVIPD